MNILFRPATQEDLPAILDIIAGARAFMKAQGLDQWQNGYPQPELLRSDIARGCSYLLCADGAPAVTGALFFAREADYDIICDGAWADDGPYAAIHRVAARTDLRGAGLSRRMMDELETLCRAQGVRSIRIDTHADNLPMRRHLEKCGYTHRGTITLSGGGGSPGDARVAYDKMLR